MVSLSPVYLSVRIPSLPPSSPLLLYHFHPALPLLVTAHPLLQFLSNSRLSSPLSLCLRLTLGYHMCLYDNRYVRPVFNLKWKWCARAFTCSHVGMNGHTHHNHNSNCYLSLSLWKWCNCCVQGNRLFYCSFYVTISFYCSRPLTICLLGLEMCVCACMCLCVCAWVRVCVRVCVGVCGWEANVLSTALSKIKNKMFTQAIVLTLDGLVRWCYLSAVKAKSSSLSHQNFWCEEISQFEQAVFIPVTFQSACTIKIHTDTTILILLLRVK